MNALTTHPRPSADARAAFGEGWRAGVGLAVGYVPFAMAMGATFAATELSPVVSWSSSWLMFAGAAQIAAVTMLDAGTAPAVVVLSALVINARHLLYGASIAPFARSWPRRWRWGLAYLLADPVFALVISRFDGDGPRSSASHRGYYLGVGISAWTAWQILTAAGLVLGGALPDALPLDLATPLTFLLLLVPTVKDRAGAAAAAVGGLTTVLAAGLPLGLSLLAGAATGITAGVLVARSTGPAAPAAPGGGGRG